MTVSGGLAGIAGGYDRLLPPPRGRRTFHRPLYVSTVSDMQTKLTLRLDGRLVRHAKQYAERSGKSLSQMVAEYFSAITSPKGSPSELTPAVSKLKGALEGTGVAPEDYGAYLEEKHR